MAAMFQMKVVQSDIEYSRFTFTPIPFVWAQICFVAGGAMALGNHRVVLFEGHLHKDIAPLCLTKV